MASDVVLVLESRHRRMRELLDRSRRPARGLADPVGELAREAAGHAAAAAELLAITRDRGLLPADGAATLGARCSELADAARRPEPDAAELASLVEETLRAEQQLLPAWAQAHVDLRRRWGRSYRSVLESTRRSVGPPRNRGVPSRTELYERARRAGISQRSRMSVSELLAAVAAAEGRGEP
jgi:hypothetical protein